MTDIHRAPPITSAPPPIPPDDLKRNLTVARADEPGMRHVAIAGDIYSIVISGAQTHGRYCLIDMLVPQGGGPPPHRHDFEESFTLLEGELQFSFRGETHTIGAGSTVNIPANAPHAFKNVSAQTAHLLCMCIPAGLDEFFLAAGTQVDSRSDTPPTADAAEQHGKAELLKTLLPRYRTEMV